VSIQDACKNKHAGHAIRQGMTLLYFGYVT